MAFILFGTWLCNAIISLPDGCCSLEIRNGKEELKQILAENKTKFSLTTDIWISFANDAYISLTRHFIDKCWEMKSYTLATY